MRQHHQVVRAMDLLSRCWVQVLHYSLAGFLLMVQSNLVNTDAEGAIEGVYIKGMSAPGGVLWISSYRDDQRIFWGYSKLLFLFLLLYHLWPFMRKGGLWISLKTVNFFHGHGAWIRVFTAWISNSTPVHSLREFFTLGVKLIMLRKISEDFHAVII